MEMTVQTCGNDSWGICVDHVYLSVAIPLLKLSILKFMMYLKGKIDMIIKPNETEVKGIIISSVVPNIMHSLENMVKKSFNINPIIVGPGVKTGINIIGYYRHCIRLCFFGKSNT